MRKSGLCDKKRGCAYFDTPSSLYKKEGLSDDRLLTIDDVDSLTRLLDADALQVVDDIFTIGSIECLDACGASHVGLWTKTAHGIGRADGQTVEVRIDFEIVGCPVGQCNKLSTLEDGIGNGTPIMMKSSVFPLPLERSASIPIN